MLIEFSVSNFRSFREKQTFSMVAAPRLRKKENVVSPVVKGEKLPDLLKMAAVYGPNASGKSNLLKALGVFHAITTRAPSTEKQALPVAPFRFDPALLDQPCRFEWHFICEQQRYSFELALTSERIIEEKLISFPMGKETILYHRQHTENGDQYHFGAQLEGGELLHRAWRALTNPQTLFIKQAVANSNEALKQLSVPFGWLVGSSATGAAEMKMSATAALYAASLEPQLATALASFLQTIDVPMVDIQFEQNADAPKNSDLTVSEWSALLSNRAQQAKAIFTHETALGKAKFDLVDESEGTRNLIGFWLCWFAHSSESDKASSILAIDELSSSLHPNIISALIKQRQTQEHQRQLIFTTHDTHLMDTKLLRRDQIWLTERNANGATQLYPIHDIEGRESEDIEKRYYEGRYRGLPVLSRK